METGTVPIMLENARVLNEGPFFKRRFSSNAFIEPQM